MTLFHLGLCAGSIYTTFLLWGLLQERLTKTPYVSAPTPLDPDPQPEYFRSPLFLNAIQASLSAVVACVYLVIRSRGEPRRSLVEVLGLHVLTPRGAARAVSQQQRDQPNGVAAQSDAAGTTRRWISPLLVRYLTIAALQSTASQLGFLSLRYLSYPTLTLAKSCKLVPVLLMNVVLYRRKFAAYKYVVVALVTVGIYLFMAFAPAKEAKGAKGRESSSALGLVLCLLNLVLDGATNSTQDEVFSKYGRRTVSAGQMMLVMNALAAGMMGCWLVAPLEMVGWGEASELVQAKAFVRRHPEVVRDMLAYALAGAVGQVAIFETLQRFGSLTLVAITVTRKLFTMLLSVVVYRHQLAALQWVGVAVVFAGIAIEAREKRREGLAKMVVNEKARAKDA
ncbi:UDP-galactose transporter [Thecaphora frezii]